MREVQKQKTCVGRPPCVIILGQTCRAKAVLVNELFGHPYLPVPAQRESVSWRTVRFKYSKKTQVRLNTLLLFEKFGALLLVSVKFKISS